MNRDSEQPHCNHFVIRKKRFCRMTVKEGEKFCGEHQINQDADDPSVDGNRRITCPLDPKHTCYANKLKKHLKKCNAKPAPNLPYIQKNVNVGQKDETSQSRSLSRVPVSHLLEVISKVNSVHKDIENCIIEKFTNHSILESELSNGSYGQTTKKHLLQASAILGLLKEYNLLQDNTSYIEFGAGKGKLSYWISKTLELMKYDSSSVLLVERASHRHKCDNKLDKTSVNVLRIRTDIADLLLHQVDIVSKSKHIVGVTKHLCGDATDLALNCLVNCKSTGKDIAGLVMTFCCLHRCQWNTYTGKQYFETVGITHADFDVMCGLVSWAVCGSGESREKRANLAMNVGQTVRDIEIGLSRIEKEIVGKKCKDIINWGRKMYLQSHQFVCDLCYYVNSEVSLENVCIVGVKERE